MKARLALIATTCVAAVISACGDPTSVKATFATSVDTLSVFALSGTPPAYPSGVNIVAARPVRVDGFADFDVAFDIDNAGNAVVYPVKLIVAGGARSVGMQKVPGTFETVTAAPKTGYNVDDPVTLARGEVVVLEAAHNIGQDVCSFALSGNIYAKIGLDSVNLASRTIYLRMGLDPNCGFRSFEAGVPTS
jgi:hypothetical protein